MERKEIIGKLLTCDLLIRDINYSLSNLRTYVFLNDDLNQEQLKKKEKDILTCLDKLKNIIETPIIK